MAIPVAVAATVASQIPWKDVIAAAPDVWKAARDLFAFSSKKAESAPVDPTADIRDQLAALAARVHEGERAQAEQAKVVAEIAGQMHAMATQMQANSARTDRLIWVAIGSCVVSVASLALLLLKLP